MDKLETLKKNIYVLDGSIEGIKDNIIETLKDGFDASDIFKELFELEDEQDLAKIEYFKAKKEDLENDMEKNGVHGKLELIDIEEDILEARRSILKRELKREEKKDTEVIVDKLWEFFDLYILVTFKNAGKIDFERVFEELVEVRRELIEKELERGDLKGNYGRRIERVFEMMEKWAEEESLGDFRERC